MKYINLSQIIDTRKPIGISRERKKDRSSMLDQNELDSLKTVLGKLGWITGQTRPDLVLETCILSSNGENAAVNEIVQANKILLKTKRENVILRFDLKGNVKNFKIAGFNDASFENLPDNSS